MTFALDIQEPSAPHREEATEMGVYVHFPWCLTKCPYCDFLSIAVNSPAPGRPATAEEARASLPHASYADAILRELERRLPELAAPRPRLRSVFFGGGTPSLWDPRELGRVLRGILCAFGIEESRPDPGLIEITVECNPTSLDPAHLEALLDQGVNRVSIGVQSLETERLRFLGRLHDEEGGLRAVRQAIAAGVPRVSADLIYGVYRQDPDRAVSEVERVAELGVSHLSAYALTIESNTRFGALDRAGKLPLLDDALVAESFSAVSGALTKLGFEHYEVSNFARPGASSKHNRGYWLGEDYLGLGTGAFGTVRLARSPETRVRYKNVLAAERYMSAFSRASAHDPFEEQLSERELIDGETSLKEALLLGLRLAEGVDVERIAALHHTDPWPQERTRAAQKLERRGKLLRRGGKLSIPREHWLFADGIIRDLL